MKQELLKGIDGVLSMTPYLNNRPAVASAVTVEVLGNAGNVIVASGTAGSINSTTGELTYTLVAANTGTVDENYQIKWTYTIAGVVYYQSSLFDIVLNKLSIPIVDADLLNEQSDLRDGSQSVSGLVTSASNTTLVQNDLKSYSDDYWNGGVVEVINPATGLKQIREVTDFVQSTGTLTVGVAWTTNPDNTYSFEVKRGFANKIESAFEEMMVEIRSKGFRPALILESGELKVPLIKKALAMICRDYIVSPDDKWASLAQKYDEQFVDMFSKVKFQYDANESGNIADNEKDQELGNVRLKR